MRAGEPLTWGSSYLLVDPKHYDVRYSINPYMDPSRPVDRALARAQWDSLCEAILEAGGSVNILDNPPEECPDMVYAMNLGYAGLTANGNRKVLMSKMRHEERRAETPVAAAWFASQGFDVHWVPEGEPCLEAGDLFPWSSSILAGLGPRSDEAALSHLSAFAGQQAYSLEVVSSHAYHLDLSFCPLTQEAALLYTDAFSMRSAECSMEMVPNFIHLDGEDALGAFAGNSIVVNETVLMPVRTSLKVQTAVEQLGLKVKLLDVSEFEKGGGSIRCLTNPLDFPLGSRT